jgi:hypothetical protein
MTIKSKTLIDQINTASIPDYVYRIGDSALKVGFFTWHYFEMMLAMMVGSTLFELLVREMPTATRYAIGIQPGTFLNSSGIALSMMIVMIAWMIVRGHGWRHSAEMAVAMLVPVAFVAVISLQKGDASLTWFQATYCSAMCVGMLLAMLYRGDHFTKWSFKSPHRGH